MTAVTIGLHECAIAHEGGYGPAFRDAAGATFAWTETTHPTADMATRDAHLRLEVVRLRMHDLLPGLETLTAVRAHQIAEQSVIERALLQEDGDGGLVRRVEEAVRQAVRRSAPEPMAILQELGLVERVNRS